MTSTFKQRAATMAGRTKPGTPVEPGTEQPAPPDGGPVDELPDVDIDEPGPDGPEQVPVHVAWSRVMADVRKIAKTEKHDAPGAKFNFRGIDRTVNAFGPVLRKHGVLVLPIGVDVNYRDTRTSQNKPTRECTVKVRWMVIGPAGDTLPEPLESAGESLDSSDKGTAKAQSVALRVLLLNAGMVPSGDPDPDSVAIERGEAPVRPATDYRDEALDPNTSYGRMRQLDYEVRQHGLAGAEVVNEHGDEEPLGALIRRVGQERWPRQNGGTR